MATETPRKHKKMKRVSPPASPEDLDASGHSLDSKDDSGSESDHYQQKRPRVKSTCRHYADNRYWVKATEEGDTLRTAANPI